MIYIGLTSIESKYVLQKKIRWFPNFDFFSSRKPISNNNNIQLINDIMASICFFIPQKMNRKNSITDIKKKRKYLFNKIETEILA